MAAHAAQEGLILSASAVAESVDSSVDPPRDSILLTSIGSAEALRPVSPACHHPAVAAVPVDCQGRVPRVNLVRMDHGSETWTVHSVSFSCREDSRPAVAVLVSASARCEWKRSASPDSKTCGHPFEWRDQTEDSHHSLATEAAELKLEEMEEAAYPWTDGVKVLS